MAARTGKSEMIASPVLAVSAAGSVDDDLGLPHAVRLDELIERGGVRQRETDATV
jgi:hypothetical protein